jgi:acetylornithine deacetylase/succinyl-diaminopimelate desuccinylase-like protein
MAMIDQVVSLAQRLVRIPSPSGQERAAVELLAGSMRAQGFAVRIDAAGNAIGTLGRGLPGHPRVVIDGHIDTIPPPADGDWSRDPFGAEILDDRLYGLGVCDQKASLAAAVVGLGSMAQRFAASPGMVSLVASVSEEFMEGAALAYALDVLRPTCVVITEPSELKLMVGHRGRAKLQVEIAGRSAHAARATDGVNAAEALADLLVELRRAPRPNHSRLGYRDITCIDVVSSPFPSVSTVPGRVQARFDVRFLPEDTEEELHVLFSHAAARAWKNWPQPPSLSVGTVEVSALTYTGQELAVREIAPGWWTEGALVDTARAALASIGLSDTPGVYSICTNGSLTAGGRGVPTIGFGVGEQHMAHRADEYVHVGALLDGARGYAALAAALLEGQVPGNARECGISAGTSEAH